jgi:hypothetical protein
MGNPTLPPDFFARKIGPAPPIAPPAQPGEVRGCLNCMRCLGVARMHGDKPAAVRCEWQGEWDWPEKGCDRWGAK